MDGIECAVCLKADSSITVLGLHTFYWGPGGEVELSSNQEDLYLGIPDKQRFLACIIIETIVSEFQLGACGMLFRKSTGPCIVIKQDRSEGLAN